MFNFGTLILILITALVGTVFIAFKLIEWILAPLTKKADEGPAPEQGTPATININISTVQPPAARSELNSSRAEPGMDSLLELIPEGMILPALEESGAGDLAGLMAEVFYVNDIVEKKESLAFGDEDVLKFAGEGFSIPYLTGRITRKVAAGLFIYPRGFGIRGDCPEPVRVIAPVIVGEGLPDKDAIYLECEANLSCFLGDARWRERIVQAGDVETVVRTIKEYEEERSD